MARRRNKKQQEETLVDLVDAKEQAQDYVSKNGTMIFGVLVGLVLLIGGYFIYQQFVSLPKEKNAQSAIRFAQDQFARDSFALALKGPGGGNPGFLDIIEQYSGTKTANTALFYSGISYLNLGNYQVAIDYLNEFNAKGDLLAIQKYSALGDAYSELKDLDKAVSNYKSATTAGENETLITYNLKKLGLLYEKQGQFDLSKAAFEKIKTEYPNSAEGRDIQKFITRVASKQ